MELLNELLTYDISGTKSLTSVAGRSINCRIYITYNLDFNEYVRSSIHPKRFGAKTQEQQFYIQGICPYIFKARKGQFPKNL